MITDVHACCVSRCRNWWKWIKRKNPIVLHCIVGRKWLRDISTHNPVHKHTYMEMANAYIDCRMSMWQQCMRWQQQQQPHTEPIWKMRFGQTNVAATCYEKKVTPNFSHFNCTRVCVCVFDPSVDSFVRLRACVCLSSCMHAQFLLYTHTHSHSIWNQRGIESLL